MKTEAEIRVTWPKSQEMPGATRSWKREEMDFLEAPEGAQPC